MKAFHSLKAQTTLQGRSPVRDRIALFFLVLFTPSLLLPVSGISAAEVKGLIHHQIEAEIIPDMHMLSLRDTITLPDDFPNEFPFSLHRGLAPSLDTTGATIHKEIGSDAVANSYRIKLPPGTRTFAVKYQGIIDHPIEPVGKEQARGFSNTLGIISEQGVFLSGSSCWYPVIEGRLLKISLRVELPSGWDAVSQGKRIYHDKGELRTTTQWDSTEPQDEIYLVAARFTEYSRSSGHIHAMVFLRTPDKELAQKYLDATIRYISMYEDLIGFYPYPKFALVENFWETGFGMPSFTLLGRRIIRLPFIINTSYPHEILHNWWGNSVFPDYARGNWSEGLTAYLSDHLLKEQAGEGSEYRRTTLQKYVDYVSGVKDFPLSRFQSRHSTSSEAIGYGKSLMFFHMLRQELGDGIFIRGLRDFYRNKKFLTASFDDLKRSLERESGKDLTEEFRQWVERTGAPELKLGETKVMREGEDYLLTVTLEQVQPGDAYLLRIPIVVTTESNDNAYLLIAEMDKKEIDLRIHLPSRPLRVDIDPEFDVFRRLDRKEIPPAISQALGATRMLIILPSSSDKAMLRAYHELSVALGNSGPDEVELKLDNEVKELPSDSAVVILGWENRFLLKAQIALSGYDVSLTSRNVSIGKTEIRGESLSVVLTARNPGNEETAMVFIAADHPQAIPGLARKLPHFHKYSYLVFEGDEPINVMKGRWSVINSPLTAFPPDSGEIVKVEMGRLTPRRPLIYPDEFISSERMMETVLFLTDKELMGRELGTRELDRTADYIASKFHGAGLKPGGDTEDSYFQVWDEDLKKDETRTVLMKNVIGVVEGRRQEYSDQSIVVGAHYDHLGLGWPDVRDDNSGKVHPGADDNASGVSILIELARAFGKMNPDRRIVFVAFTGEEAGKRGSKHYVAYQKRYPVSKCLAMINLDTVGRLGKGKLLILGSSSAKEWVHIIRGAGLVAGVDIDFVPEVLDSSDQISFQEAGVPAVQLFTGPHPDYHRPSDTPDKIDPEGMKKVASVAKEIIEHLSNRKDPMTVEKNTGYKEESIRKERKVSLGAIPDFAYGGKGCRISGTTPGSPAETCGLKEGDIIIRINSSEVHSLRHLSEILSSIAPGSRVSITFLRDGKEMNVEAEVKTR